MKCTKCNKNIPEDAAVCPYCHKVLTLICPNCHTSGQSPVCSKCGYIILEKCSKCGKTVPTTKEKCKCGFPVKTSVAYQECETDEFASVSIKFGALKTIRRLLNSQELYAKFLVKLKNLITSQLKGVDGKVVIYDNEYVVNFNKELSFPTSVNKAVRLGLKVANSFTGLNLRMLEELGTPLKLSITIFKKTAEELLDNRSFDTNVKLLTVKKNEKKYLKGLQIILDQYSQECISKDYKTDSLYSLEQDGSTVMYYEIITENYILPPNEDTEAPIEVSKTEINKYSQEDSITDDIYGFKVFDINAKCKFEKLTAGSLLSKLNPEDKIVSIRCEQSLGIQTSELIKFYEKNGKRTLYVNCTEKLSYKPWGVLTELFKDFYGIPNAYKLSEKPFNISRLQNISDLISGKARKAATYEDARFGYMEDFVAFLRSLKNCTVIIDGFENIDDTTLQTLGIYFDKFQNVNTGFVFITDSECIVHTKLKGLLRTPLYTEYSLQKAGVGSLLSDIKEDASDFIQSFYFEKIKENYGGSRLYFDNAIRFLIEKGVLINFENKLLIKNNNSFLLPKSLKGLLKSRLKTFGKNQDGSMILAYSAFLGARIDFQTLEAIGIKDVAKNAKLLEEHGFGYVKGDILYINNYNLLSQSIEDSLKKDVREIIAKTLLAKLGKYSDNTTLIILMGSLKMYKDEYLLMWKNSQFAIIVGDYDGYLKNCLGFLSLTEHLEENISKEEIENCKKEVFNNILISLYSYSPDKIYSIENILLMDAMRENDDDKIVKLSNLMLQGALISANYTNALNLLHNILTRIPNPSLIVDGEINTKFLLLSLVNIEILFNIGDFRRCIEVGTDMLKVIKSDIIEKIKPVNFSTNFFVSHMLDTFKLVGLAKIIAGDKDLERFYDSVKTSFNAEFPDKDSFSAIKDFIAGKDYVSSNTDGATPFSKIIYLLLDEASRLKDDYKNFAQNVYQAKLLASDIHQAQMEYLCDVLIAHSYSKLGITKKAEHIFNDVLEKSEKSAIFNTVMFARYFMAKLKLAESDFEECFLIINDALALIQKQKNQAKLFYVMFEQLFIDALKISGNSNFDVGSEEMKLINLQDKEDYTRIINVVEPQPEKEEKNQEEPVEEEIISGN